MTIADARNGVASSTTCSISIDLRSRSQSIQRQRGSALLHDSYAPARNGLDGDKLGDLPANERLLHGHRRIAQHCLAFLHG